MAASTTPLSGREEPNEITARTNITLFLKTKLRGGRGRERKGKEGVRGGGELRRLVRWRVVAAAAAAAAAVTSSNRVYYNHVHTMVLT